MQSPACCGTILRCQKEVWMVVCIGVHCWKDGCRECTHHSDSLRYSFLVRRSHAAVVCVCVSPFCLNGPEWLFFVHLPFLGILVQVTISWGFFTRRHLECQGPAVDIGSLLYYLPLLGHGPTTLGIDVPPFAGCNWSRWGLNTSTAGGISI